MAGGDRAGLVEHDGVDLARRLQHLRALDQQAELSAAAGADQQRRRRRQAEGARAGDDQHGHGRGEGEGRCPRRPRPRSRRCRWRSGSRPARTPRRSSRPAAAPGALPDWASVTRRPIWLSAVSAPTLVARTIRRPPALIVAPATSEPGPTSTGTLSPVSRELSIAEWPSSTTPSVATFSPGRTTKRWPTARSSTAMRCSSPCSSRTLDFLGAQLEQRLQRGAGAALGAGLEVAAGEDERRDHGGDLQVDLVAPRRRARAAARTASSSRCGRRHPGTARRATTTGPPGSRR